MWKPNTENMDRKSDEMSTDNPKGGDSIVPVDIRDRRAWTYQAMGVSEALEIIREGILRWWRRKLMREFCRELRWSSSSWRRFGTSRGVKELAGKYAWVGKAWYKYTEVRKVLLNNKDWKAGRDCLEREMTSTWW